MLPISHIHTYPQQMWDQWAAQRHLKDGLETFKGEIGFHLKSHGREGSIYYVDESKRVCECSFELSGSPEYDILVFAEDLNEWFLPKKKRLTAAEKNEIIARMKNWFAQSNTRARLP